MSPMILDLSALPEEARIEVIDFYEFVKQKHLQKANISPKRREIDWEKLVPRTVPSFTPLTRDEAHER